MFKALALVTGLSLANAAIAQDFALASNDITGPNLEMAQLANGFGCTGGNVSPKLHRPGAPEGPARLHGRLSATGQTPSLPVHHQGAERAQAGHQCHRGDARIHVERCKEAKLEVIIVR